MAALSYLGVISVLSTQSYTFTLYISFVVVIGAQLLAGAVLDMVTRGTDARYRALPILTVCLIHVVVMIYTYIFGRTPVSGNVVGSILFFLGMSTVGTLMLGEIVPQSLTGRRLPRGPWKA